MSLSGRSKWLRNTTQRTGQEYKARLSIPLETVLASMPGGSNERFQVQDRVLRVDVLNELIHQCWDLLIWRDPKPTCVRMGALDGLLLGASVRGVLEERCDKRIVSELAAENRPGEDGISAASAGRDLQVVLLPFLCSFGDALGSL